MKKLLTAAKKLFFSRAAIFIYGFMTGWISYMAVLVIVMRTWN